MFSKSLITLGAVKMPDEEIEIFVKSENISDIKEEIFRTFPNLRPYSNSFRLIREFGENEECGTSTGVFKVSPNKDIEIEIIYEKC